MSSPSAPQLPPDIDNGPYLKAVWWTELSIATVFIILRLWSRLVKRTHGLDDALMIGSWVRFFPLPTILSVVVFKAAARSRKY